MDGISVALCYLTHTSTIYTRIITGGIHWHILLHHRTQVLYDINTFCHITVYKTNHYTAYL